MAAFHEGHRDFYTIETGWKKLPQGGYTPEYKLSIAQHQRINRIRRFQYAIYVSSPAPFPEKETHAYRIRQNPCMSEYALPPLNEHPAPLTNPKKEIIIKKPQPPPQPALLSQVQKPISVFLTPATTTNKLTPENATLQSRQQSLLQRIRDRSQIAKDTPANRDEAEAWYRGEWIIQGLFMLLSQMPGRPRVAVSFGATVKQLVSSSGMLTSAAAVRAGVEIVARAVPWFVRVIRLREGGVMGPECRSTREKPENNFGGQMVGSAGNRVFGGKENGRGRQIEGLLIFARRDGGMVIGLEDVLREFRAKKREWEMTRI